MARVSAKASNAKLRSKTATDSHSSEAFGAVGRSGFEGNGRRLLGILFLLLAVGTGAAIRIHTTLSDPNFDTADARPLLRSDPGLLHYITERIVESGGLPPDDFGADARKAIGESHALLVVQGGCLVAERYGEDTDTTSTDKLQKFSTINIWHYTLLFITYDKSSNLSHFLHRFPGDSSGSGPFAMDGSLQQLR